MEIRITFKLRGMAADELTRLWRLIRAAPEGPQFATPSAMASALLTALLDDDAGASPDKLPH